MAPKMDQPHLLMMGLAWDNTMVLEVLRYLLEWVSKELGEVAMPEGSVVVIPLACPLMGLM